PRVEGLVVHGDAHAEAELGVVLEERVGPRGATADAIPCPRRGRLAPPVDGRAPRRVGDERAIAEEVAGPLEVRRLSAARARAGELEQRLEELDVLDLTGVERVAIRLRQVEEEAPVLRL